MVCFFPLFGVHVVGRCGWNLGFGLGGEDIALVPSCDLDVSRNRCVGLLDRGDFSDDREGGG